MARVQDFNGTAFPLPASGTLTIASRDIQSEGVVAYLVSLQGTGAVLGGTGVQRVRIKADGETIIEFTSGMLIEFMKAFAPNQPSIVSGTSTIFAIPLMDLTAPTEDAQDVQQFPIGRSATIELITGSGPSGATATVGWVQTSIGRNAQPGTPLTMPRINMIGTGVSASTKNAQIPLATPGIVRAFGFPTGGLEKVELKLGGNVVHRLTYEGGSGLAVAEAQLYGGNEGTAGTRVARISARVRAPAGSSAAIIDTGAAWAGPGNEMLIYTTEPQTVR